MPLYVHGARLVAQYGMGPVGDGIGLIHPVFSYCGRITIAVTACREMMPDPGFYAECLEESYGEMRAATIEPRPVAAAPKRVNGRRRQRPGPPSPSSCRSSRRAAGLDCVRRRTC